MPIVAGECEFTTPRPFEARSARVKLSFTVDPGESVEKMIADTGAQARTHAYAMINGSEIVQHVPAEAPRTRAPRAVPPTAPAVAAEPPPAPMASEVQSATGALDPFGVAGVPASSAPASV